MSPLLLRSGPASMLPELLGLACERFHELGSMRATYDSDLAIGLNRCCCAYPASRYLSGAARILLARRQLAGLLADCHRTWAHRSAEPDRALIAVPTRNGVRPRSPFTRSLTTLSRSAFNRKSLGQRFVRISVSDQSHSWHACGARPRSAWAL